MQRNSLLRYHQLRADEESAWRRDSPAAALTRRARATARRLRGLLRGLTRYSSKQSVDLVRVAPNKADLAAARLCSVYRGAGDLERAFLRCQVPGEHAWTLLIFSRRAAVRALQTGEVDHLRDALAAHTLENLMQGDVRDNLVALGLVYHCAKSIKAAPAKLFREAAETAGPALASVLRDFVRRKDLAGILGAMGFRRVSSKEGVGFRVD